LEGIGLAQWNNMNSNRAPGAVIVGTALTEAGIAAVKQADAWARRLDTSLAICHVLPRADAIAPLMPHLYRALPESSVLEAATDAIRRYVDAHTDRDGEYDIIVEHGSAHARLVEVAAAHEPTLLVVGTNEKAAATRLLVGSTSEQVVRHAPCDVLVARPHASDGVVVAATDLSSSALPAIEAAAFEAVRREAALLVMHAIHVTPAVVAALEPAFAMDDETLALLREGAEQIIRGALQQLGADGTAHVLVGHPVDIVVAACSEVDASLLVVAAHGHSALRRLALGSTAEALVRRASCSVLVAHG
jgi:nucleotide-binding universal stress UspA family protein